MAPTLLNADFSHRVLLHGASLPWVDSPLPGVQRRMLDRIGDEVARATSIVRYAPGSVFAPHAHGGGEEFVVLEGVFQDEHGDYPAGCYVRNPPGTQHAPRSDAGCIIFVKLWQFDPADRAPLVMDLDGAARASAPHEGIASTLLFEHARETVRLLVLAPQARLDEPVPDGAELLLLDGSLVEGGERLERWSWLRLPCDARLDAAAGEAGARLWIKTRHLRFVAAPGVS